jgi:hypothetical protein
VQAGWGVCGAGAMVTSLSLIMRAGCRVSFGMESELGMMLRRFGIEQALGSQMWTGSSLMTLMARGGGGASGGELIGTGSGGLRIRSVLLIY